MNAPKPIEKTREEILKAAEALLKKDKDYYPADALDKDSCFYNGQIGNCGINCPSFKQKKCENEKEVLENDKIRTIENSKADII